LDYSDIRLFDAPTAGMEKSAHRNSAFQTIFDIAPLCKNNVGLQIVSQQQEKKTEATHDKNKNCYDSRPPTA